MMVKAIFYKINSLIYIDPKKKANYLRKKGFKLGENCEIFPGVNFGSEPYLVQCGNNVKITAGVKLITHDGGMHVLRNLGLCPDADRFGRITIGNNVFIGIDSIVLPGVEIGDNCVIGAGSIVTHNIEANSVAAGIPAKVIKDINRYYEDNKLHIVDTKHMSYNAKKEYLYKKYELSQ